MEVILYSQNKEFYKINNKTVEVTGVHVGYGTKEPKRLEAHDATVKFQTNSEELDEIIDFIFEGVTDVEIKLTNKHSIKGEAKMFMTIEKEEGEIVFKIQMNVK